MSFKEMRFTNKIKLLLAVIVSMAMHSKCISQNTDTIYFSEGYVDYKPLLDKIKNGEAFYIKFVSSGCFHHQTEKLKIEKKENKYFASYNDKTINLSNKQLTIVREFEGELKKPRYMFICTTTETYDIIYLDDSQQIIDSSCDWHGFNNLLVDLSLTSEK